LSHELPLTRKPALAASELAVMKMLWEKGDLTAREILEELYPRASRSQHGTVQKLLQRLTDKGYVKRDPSTTILRFSARISQDDYLGAELESLADQLTGGSFAPLITFLLEEKKLSRGELKKLKRLVEDE
jgi:BlaI family penicillinase repressor